MKVSRILCLFFVLLGLSSFALGAEQHKWGFLGNGFHMQFYINFDAESSNITYQFDLPNSFFIDTAEAEQLYIMKKGCDVKNVDIHSCEDITHNYLPLSVKTSYLCDIEAPVFKVPNTNTVVIQLERKNGVERNSGVATLVFPIHARYEELLTDQPFDWVSFVSEENSYVNRCMNTISVSSGLPLQTVESDKDAHCRNIPVGRLSDLPLVYRSLMTLLVTGAAIVILFLSF